MNFRLISSTTRYSSKTFENYARDLKIKSEKIKNKNRNGNENYKIENII